MVEPISNAPAAIALPSRPAQSKDAASISSIALRSNHFELVVKGSKKNYIYAYSFSFEPEIPLDQRGRRYAILDAVKGELEKDLGKFLVSGWMIFSSIKKENPIFKQIKKENIKGGAKEEKDINLKILLAEERDIGGISSVKKEPTLQFFNIVIKKALKELKFVEIGKNSKFYDQSKIVDIPDYGLEVWKGFKTATDVYKSGLYTLIDFSSRILRQESVNDFIKRCLKDGLNQKDINNELIGTSCLGYYGNFTMWRIDDIDWKKTPLSKFKKESGEDMTYVDYFKLRYNIKIIDTKQPLIYHKHKRTGQEFYLIPELMRQTGITDEMRNDFGLMKGLAVHTKLEPDQRMNLHILDVSKKINEKLPKLIDNVQLDCKANDVKGKKLEEPQIIVANGKRITPAGGNFQLREPVIEAANLKSWAIIYHKFDFETCDRLYQTLRKCSGAYGINVTEPQWIEVESKSSKDWEAALKATIPKMKDPLIIVALIPAQAKKTHYPMIKRFCCNTRPIPSQVVCTKSLMKNEMSVCSKILLQMNAKLGLTLWQTQLPKGLPKNTMIIGADVFHNVGQRDKKRSVIGFCASLDPAFTKFYTQVHFQAKKGDEFMTTIPNLVKKAIQVYFAANKKTYPDNIIFYRDGVGESQNDIVREQELNQILNLLKEFYGEKAPPLAYFIVTKRINDRFFCEDEGRGGGRGGRGGQGGPKGGLTNPPSGTIVNDKVVTKNFDFFLIAQNVTQGTCTPTRYEAIYNGTAIPEDVFWAITYYQCFNYYNWSGAIRVPACAMYAHKAGFMVGQTLSENPDETLANSLYFL